MPTRKTPPDDVSGGAVSSGGTDAPNETRERVRRAALESGDAPTPDNPPSPLFGDVAQIPTVRRVIAREHDVLMFMFPGQLTRDQVERLRVSVREAFPTGTNVLIMSEGVNVEVIGREVEVSDALLQTLVDRFVTSGPAGVFDALAYGRAILALAEGKTPDQAMENAS